MNKSPALSYFRKMAILACMLPLPGVSQSPTPTPAPTHSGDGGPVLAILITEKSYNESRLALHCSDTDECRLCEYSPDSDTPGPCHPDHARFYISNRNSSDNNIFFTGINHCAVVEITPLKQEHSRCLSCSGVTEMPRCRLGSRTSCDGFYLMDSDLYSNYIDNYNDPDRPVLCSMSVSGFISYYQTPVVIKNDSPSGEFGNHKTISCKWAAGDSDRTGSYCRMVFEHCNPPQDQCKPEKFILHMERPFPTNCFRIFWTAAFPSLLRSNSRW